ncbi:hypothetical protein FRB97_001041 [Tulasnella sp. 331]|nr:hypothetical protein FRB97_001041 [Tulasnella sp. 331]
MASQEQLSIELQRLLQDDRSTPEHDKERHDERRSQYLSTNDKRSHRHRVPTFLTLSLLAIILVLSIIIGYQNRRHIPKSLSDLQGVLHLINQSQEVETFSETVTIRPGRGSGSCLCPRTPTGQQLCEAYPPAALRRSRVHTGTNARLKRVLKRYMNSDVNGEKLKIGIMGGSVSACHGATTNGDPMDSVCYPKILADWLEERLGDGTRDSIVIRNGAIGGMDSSYYAFCGMNHLPPDVDIVILEFDVNDQPSKDFIIYFDQLVRVVLSLPSNPAILILGAWGPLISYDLGSLTPLVPHLPSAHYYDIPYVSLKPLLFDTFLRFPNGVYQTFYTEDGFHPNVAGQRLLADVAIGYLESVLCEIESENTEGWTDQETWVGGGLNTLETTATGFESLVTFKQAVHSVKPDTPPINLTSYAFLSLSSPTSVPPLPLPAPLSLYLDYMQPDPPSLLASNHLNLGPVPFCADANDPQSPLTPKENGGEGSMGWKTMVWKGEKHFWVSDTVGARLVVDIVVNEGRLVYYRKFWICDALRLTDSYCRVAVFYFRSEDLSPGVADCWVDDNRKGAQRLEGHWNQKSNVPSVMYIDSEVTPGDH